MKEHRLQDIRFDARYIDRASFVTVGAFMQALCVRMHEVGCHSLRVTAYSLIIANSCGVRGSGLMDIYRGARLHDIGKIGVPYAVLNKPGPLDANEQFVMHQHPDIGCRIIKNIGRFSRASDIIRSHHEHFDGSGYPRGLRGDAIPHGARVLAVADALDALTVKRPYREALSYGKAMEEIIKASGKIYDPAVIQAAVRESDELRALLGSGDLEGQVLRLDKSFFL